MNKDELLMNTIYKKIANGMGLKDGEFHTAREISKAYLETIEVIKNIRDGKYIGIK